MINNVQSLVESFQRIRDGFREDRERFGPVQVKFHGDMIFLDGSILAVMAYRLRATIAGGLLKEAWRAGLVPLPPGCRADGDDMVLWIKASSSMVKT